MTIDAYLAELKRRLPWLGRRRVLAEVEDHLRDAARRHETVGVAPRAAEAAATADFGDVDVIARRLASETALRETRFATVVGLGAVAFFVFPLYVVPENTLPPAQWTVKPYDILVLQLLTVATWVLAGALALAGAALAWTRWPHVAALVNAVVLVALTCSTFLSAVLVVRWDRAVADTPLWPLLSAPLALACLAACALAAGWALRRRRLLVDD